MKYILATNNMSKVSEMRMALSRLEAEVASQAEIGIDIEPDETGATFEENALIKARAVCVKSGLPAIADDSGLEVYALDGAPGVYSKRFGGGGLSDEKLCAYLLEKLINTEQRGARFVCCIACVFPDGKVVSARGECEGEILRSPRGSAGFGYDPVFLVRGTDKSMAEMTAEEKNEVSHRGRALRAFVSEMHTGLDKR